MAPLTLNSSCSKQLIPPRTSSPFFALLWMLYNLSYSKILRGFNAYKRNSGKRHPLSLGNKRAVREEQLKVKGQWWIGSISVGTPPVQFTVAIDTGTSDLVLPGVNCDNCVGQKPFNTSASSTSVDLKATFTIPEDDDDGSVTSGELFNDTVSIGGLTATHQTLGVAKEYNDDLYKTNGFTADGLIGMGFEHTSRYNATPVFQSLVAEGRTESSLFAMKLADKGAELTLGYLNSDLYTGAVAYAPITTPGYWIFNVDAINVSGHGVLSNMSCVVDSVRIHYCLHHLTEIFLQGSFDIVGDIASVTAFWEKIPGASNSGQGFYTFPCNATLPTVSFTIGGKDFPITTQSLNHGPLLSNPDTCIGSILMNPYIVHPIWILGSAFMANFYTVFDVGNSRVGFATLA
jgi:cathepsin D